MKQHLHENAKVCTTDTTFYMNGVSLLAIRWVPVVVRAAKSNTCYLSYFVVRAA